MFSTRLIEPEEKVHPERFLCTHTSADFVRAYSKHPGIWSGIACKVCGHISGTRISTLERAAAEASDHDRAD